MKKLLLILLCLPMIGFGQDDGCISGNCITGYGKYMFYIAGAIDDVPVIYEGNFKDGKFNGLGNLSCPSTGKFEGETGSFKVRGNWNNGKLSGDVIVVKISQQYSITGEGWTSDYSHLEYETVWKYSGQYKDSLRDGFGVMNITQFIDKDAEFYENNETTTESYVGQWKNNKKEGQGTYTYANDDIYKGEWKNGMKHGEGTLTYANIWGQGPSEGDKYVGKWKNDKKHGIGIYTWVDGPLDGDKYVGEWKNGEEHGKGSYYDNYSGTIEKGLWENGKFMGR